MKITVGKSKRIMASESDGNYDISFNKNGTTYYIEMLSDGGNYVAKWWDSSDNGLGYNNKGWVAIEGKNYRALNSIENVNSDNVVGLLSVISDYDRKPGKPIQDRIKREVAKLVDFGFINSGCTKKSVKASAGNSVELTFICPDLETGRSVVDKAREIGGFGSTWNETKWVYIDVPSTQSVDNVDDLIDYAQSIGVYLNKPSAKLIDDWADVKLDRVLRGCTDVPIKSNKINKRRAITAAEGLNDMKIIVKSEAFVDITVDDYEQGALNMVNSWDFDVRGEYDTLQELIDRIADESYVFSNNIADYYYMDGRIGTSAMVDADNSVPTDDQYEAWKRGEETLYIADLYLPLEVGGGSHEMTEEEAEAFGLALY